MELLAIDFFPEYALAPGHSTQASINPEVLKTCAGLIRKGIDGSGPLSVFDLIDLQKAEAMYLAADTWSKLI